MESKKTNNHCLIESFMFICKNHDFKLVMGIATMTEGEFKGKRTLHCWNEFNNIVFDISWNIITPKENYYKFLEITQNQSYDFAQVIDNFYKHGCLDWWHIDKETKEKISKEVKERTI